MRAVPYLIAAGVGFILSFLSGVIGRVGFPELLFRALFFAIIFGGGAFGLGILLQRFFPELFEEEKTDEVGGRVDMTVGEQDYEMPPMEESFTQEIDPSLSSSSPESEEELGEMDEFDKTMDTSAGSEATDTELDELGGGVRDKDGVLLEGIDEDPVVLAKAVQTVLKKDKE